MEAEINTFRTTLEYYCCMANVPHEVYMKLAGNVFISKSSYEILKGVFQWEFKHGPKSATLEVKDHYIFLNRVQPGETEQARWIREYDSAGQKQRGSTLHSTLGRVPRELSSRAQITELRKYPCFPCETYGNIVTSEIICAQCPYKDFRKDYLRAWIGKPPEDTVGIEFGFTDIKPNKVVFHSKKAHPRGYCSSATGTECNTTRLRSDEDDT